ncbi:MAG: phosphonoacetaldehyde reductase [Alphaproteobacteria bacterium]|nr:phosphonoacetaldehyde reductase [Alphaproteobacteria bacterium]
MYWILLALRKFKNEAGVLWSYHNPVRVQFGPGSFEELGACIGGRSYGLVTYPDAFCTELTERLAALVGPAAVVINDVAANPDYALLEAQTQKIADAPAPEVWVALGGGSVIDSAKVFAAANGDFGNVARFLETGSGAEALSATPIIAVPTTAGTGSEVTCWATVWNEATGKKFSLARPNLYPETALVDPALMCGKPLALTVSTGLDALSHSLESLWNVNANPVSANHAVYASREVMDVLPALVADLENIELRSRMARAATFAGLAFSNTKTAIAHSLSYPITLKHNVPHGIACSFSLPIVIESVTGVGGLCEDALGRIFEGDMPSAVTKVSNLLTSLNVSTKPADHGVGDSEWAGLVDGAFDGERGKNFIGEKDRFLKAAEALGAAAA